MNNTIASMHAAFLAEIREKREALQAELEELRAVEKYHEAQLAATSNGSTREEEDAGQPTPYLDELGLLGATKHDAAATAIKHIGRPAKVGEIVDWLKQYGYDADLKRRIAFNGIYTALKRRDDMFVELDDSRWGLREEGEVEAMEDTET